MSRFFHGREVVIASMHGKEKVIAPVLERLGMKPVVATELDTDQFGTFSGEIERKGEPIEVLRSKCKAGFMQRGIDLAIASEGSFGPHPSLYFIPADDEFILIKDFRNDLEICVRELSTSTNFAFKDVKTAQELIDFAKNVGFPQHGLILRNGQNKIVKGITSEESLFGAFVDLQRKIDQPVRVETDMRALFNPTRMEVIASAAEKLFEAISAECPACQMPDFSIRKTLPGLPCGHCGLPTSSSRAFIRICQFCDHEEIHSSERLSEDPMYCNFCNP